MKFLTGQIKLITFFLSLFSFSAIVLLLPVLALASPLTVELRASPDSGEAPLKGVTLSTKVTAAWPRFFGNLITYKFDCENDGTWDYVFSNITNNPQILDYGCSYDSPGSYTAKAFVETELGTGQDTVSITVSAPARPFVDLRAGSFDGAVTLAYNSSVNLNWTSSDVSSCQASGSWSGSKSASGSEYTGNLASKRTYTLTCSGSLGSASDSVTIYISPPLLAQLAPSAPAPAANLAVVNLVRNLSDGTRWLKSAPANPSEILVFQISVKSENSALQNVVVKNILPQNINFKGNLKIDGTASAGDIVAGLNIGNLSTGQTKIIAFEAELALQDKFGQEQTKLTNSASASSGSVSGSDSTEVVVSKEVARKPTEISTGLTDNIFFDSFFLPLLIALAAVWVFKSRIFQIEKWLDLRKEKYQRYQAEKLLQLKIKRIKIKEWLKKKLA